MSRDERGAHYPPGVMGRVPLKYYGHYKRSQYTKIKRDKSMKYKNQLRLRDGEVCKNCGAMEDLTIDHVTPLSKGGSTELHNLQFLCNDCNNKKGSTDIY